MENRTNQVTTEIKREEEVLDVLIAPDKKLKQKADPVVDMGYEEYKLIEDMFATMEASNGIGLAANQVGVNKRIITVNVPQLEAYNDASHEGFVTYGKFVLVNPLITQASDIETGWAEGCLSVPGFQSEISRPRTITVDATNEKGQTVQIKAAGLLAACIQHEIDHLEGILFIDRISRLKRDVILRKLKKFRKTGRLVVRAHRAASF